MQEFNPRASQALAAVRIAGVTATLLCNVQLLDPEAPAPRRGSVLVEAGRISRIVEAADVPPEGAARVDYSGRSLAPGFIDLHFHGELIFPELDELPSLIDRTAASLLAFGTTGFLITTVAWERERLAEFVEIASASMTRVNRTTASILGLHLEGPWINPAAAGAQPAAGIRDFDPGEGEKLLDSGAEAISMVTLAPERPRSADLLVRLRERGIVAALGHSNADAAQIDAAIQAGMTHVTHVFNAMSGLHHRGPGTAGCALGDDRLSCDLICDGVHVHPMVVGLAARAKRDQLLLISDRVSPPEGSGVAFGSGRVFDDGRALRLEDGTLAGSNLTLDRAVRNAQGFGALSRMESIAAVTLRPARLLGIEAERGTLRPGARADFVILDDNDQVTETWLAGTRVYKAE